MPLYQLIQVSTNINRNFKKLEKSEFKKTWCSNFNKKQAPKSEATNKGTTYTNWTLWKTKCMISRAVYMVFLFSTINKVLNTKFYGGQMASKHVAF
jgi:hypothetical protein